MQHFGYQPLFPTGSKYLQQKWDKASYDMHRSKLEEQQMMKIQRENNMLLEKISHIMKTTGHVDNRNYYERKSLSREKRQQELLRITKENQMILLRLGQCRPFYSVKVWHEEWLKTLKVMDSIAQYPRGSASQEKGQGKPSKRSSDFETGEKTNADASGHSSENYKTNGQAEYEDKEGKTETGTQEEAGTQINAGAETHLSPEPSGPEKPKCSPITKTPNIQPHTAEGSSLSDRSEMSNTPNTSRTSTLDMPKTREQEPADSENSNTNDEG